MAGLAKVLQLQHTHLDLELGSKKRVFEQVGLWAENELAVARSTIYDSLFARERLGSTGLGQGVAIPHGRIKGLKGATGFFIRMKEPIPFEAPDSKPVRLIFALLVPENATDLHLQLLSELAQLFSDRNLREQLLLENDPAAVHRLLTEWQPHAASHR